jgi:putative ABC transport system permease protein
MKRSLRSWLWRVPRDQEVDEEIAFHLEMRVRELVARGMDPAAAREAAARRLGDRAQLTRTCVDLARKRDRDMRVMQWLGELKDDVRFALRQMRAAPVFTGIAALTLALGIGGNSAIFALVDATLLRPLPFPKPDRLTMIWERTATSGRSGASPLNMLDWAERGHSFEIIGGFVPYVGGMVMAGRDGTAETVPRQWVTSNFFNALGVRPVAGRMFQSSDDSQRSKVVVLSEAFWRSRFDSDPSVIGRIVQLDGAPFTVVGVAPNEAQLLRTSMWALVPIARRPQLRGVHQLEVVGRLKPGVTLAAANADLSTVADALAREFPETNKGRGVRIEPLHDALIGGELRRTSMLFLGVVGFVLLICCANVANLLLARATVRSRELAIRSAIGAGRPRLIRQLLTESLVLAVIGGALGAAIGAVILAVAPSLIPDGLLPPTVSLVFDARIVTFCVIATLTVGVLFGLAPAWQGSDAAAAQALSSTSRSVTGRGGRLRGLLVASEVATAVVLLFGAGLLLRTLLAVDRVDPGYRANQVLTMMVDPLGAKYPTDESLLQFFDAIEHEVRSLPNVGGIAWSSSLPMGGSVQDQLAFDIVGDAPFEANRRPTTDYQIVSPSYFSTLDLPIVAGRGFDEHDTKAAVPICIVNEAFVRGYLHGRSPVGVRIALRPPDAPQAKPVIREIVGVARQVKGRPDELEDVLQVYVPLAQDPLDDMYLAVRPSSGRAELLAGSVRAAIGRIDKEQLVSVRDVTTLEDVAWEATSRHRFRAVMVITFAGLALTLAMIGVFGILAYSVQQRMRDFGVRRALGATGGDVARLVVSSATRVVAIGGAVGLIVAAIFARLLATMLFGVQPLDPTTFAAVIAVLLVTAALAIAGPAWRATRIDPVVALRNE